MATELLVGINDQALASPIRDNTVGFLTPKNVAGAILYAITQPAHMGIEKRGQIYFLP